MLYCQARRKRANDVIVGDKFKVRQIVRSQPVCLSVWFLLTCLKQFQSFRPGSMLFFAIWSFMCLSRVSTRRKDENKQSPPSSPPPENMN